MGNAHVPLESAIETRSVDDIKREWPRALTRKLNGAGNRDWPDRLVILPDVPVFFIEFKRPGEDPRPSQQFFIEWLRSLGILVFVCHSREEAMAACRQAEALAIVTAAALEEAINGD